MASIDASQLLRDGLLEGVGVLVAGASSSPHPDGSLAGAVEPAVRQLAARVACCGLLGEDSRCAEEEAIERDVERVLGDLGAIDLLAVDGAGLFAAAGAHERDGLVVCLEASWIITRAVVNRALLAEERPGRVVYLAPPPTAGAHADATRAGLENLARTLSIEWARHGVTPVTIAPGADTRPAEVAALTAYLASPAGAYFSGCLLDLRGPAAEV